MCKVLDFVYFGVNKSLTRIGLNKTRAKEQKPEVFRDIIKINLSVGKLSFLIQDYFVVE